MAVISLRNLTVRLEDGYTGPSGIGTGLINFPAWTGIGTGAINNMSGYAAGATTVVVDGFTGAVTTGKRFTIAGDSVVHTVTAHTETLGATTSITFTPALGADVADDAAITPLGGYPAGVTSVDVDGFTGAVVVGDYITFESDVDEFGLPIPHKISSSTETLGATTSITFTPATQQVVPDNDPISYLPHFINVKIGEGNISYTEKRNVEYKLDRGRIDSVRLGNDSPVEVKVSFTWESLASLTNDPPTVEEFLKRTGPAADYVNAASDPCTPYSVRLIVTDTPPCTTVAPTLYQFDNFLWEELAHDVKNAQVDISAKCNIAFAQVTRVES